MSPTPLPTTFPLPILAHAPAGTPGAPTSRRPPLTCILLTALLPLLAPPGARAATPNSWNIPLAGNAFATTIEPGSNDGLDRSGSLRWHDPATVFSVFFHVDRPCELDLSLRARQPDGRSVIQANAGSWSATSAIEGAEARAHPLGRLAVAKPGYVRLDLRGKEKSGPAFAEAAELAVTSTTPGLQLAFVRDNQGNMFYWGRRGPSVHLGYQLPRGKTITHAYSELTVPEGLDPIGSYFMANGFGEGYFGIQVKSPTERWILFSVWSPFHTDNPRDIPADQRVLTLAKGEGVHAGSFGGEGSGGQSYLVFPWRAGITYKFLTSVAPDGKGSTIYSAWFGEATKPEWKLIARFQRPRTDKHLTGFHSFLENFADRLGYRERKCLHSNQWVRDTDGHWHEITTARFTGDGTAGGGHRLDFAGGVEGPAFFLRNGGFFSPNVPLNQSFTRTPTPDRQPAIDPATLP